MTRKFAIRLEAEAEATDAATWYEQKSQTLAARFAREFRSTLARIIGNPFQYQIIEDEMRRAPLAGFPYGILYVVSDDEVVILSCFHGSRDPAGWREPLPR
ncbi:MAG TPA: type II toxin-antitoxin system RelE/ParE family toxin [Pseudolabrys sp.]|jgi:plasmid stabilization system protein ParE